MSRLGVGSEWVVVAGPMATLSMVRVLAVETAFVLVEDPSGPADEWGCKPRRWISVGQFLVPATPALWCSISPVSPP